MSGNGHSRQAAREGDRSRYHPTMPGDVLRVLLLADTHLGFDLPQRPRVEYRRRGPDFFANTERALAPAHGGEVDLVVHGGDLLFRSKVGAWLVERAFRPLLEVADRGVPVVVVPGNHERSNIPFPLLAAHQYLHILDRPRTLRLECRGMAVAVSGFPCQRDRVDTVFRDLVQATDWDHAAADVRLLCIHQTVEGARVGPAGYTFRPGHDVISGRDIPAGFAAVLAGHIHRHQVLSAGLGGRPLAAPVLYPGSIERTSAAERHETKGYLTLELEPDRTRGGRLASWTFDPLPARPLVDLDLEHRGETAAVVVSRLEQSLAELDPDAVVRVWLDHDHPPEVRAVLTVAAVRRLAPPTMTVTVRPRR